MIEIDGSWGEGGGQIVRTAVGLSAVTGKPLRIYNIRAGRCNPGLQAQHLTGINACAEICDAKVKGNVKGCSELIFIPGKIKGGNYKINVGTAGAVSLVLQTLVLPSMHADSEIILEIAGGTHVRWSPPLDYFQHVFCWFTKLLGIDISVSIERYGFYPKGGGRVLAKIKPCNKLNRLELDKRGDFAGLCGISVASANLRKARVAERQAEAAEKIFGKIERDVKYVTSLSSGSALFLRARYENCVLGASALGELGKPAEAVGRECAELLNRQMNSEGCTDEWMGDQILPFLALSGGRISTTKITNHCLTNIWVIEKFLPVKFTVTGEIGKSGIIEVHQR